MSFEEQFKWAPTSMAFCLFSRYCALLFNLFLTLIYIFQVVGGEGVWAETPLNIGSTYTAYW